MRIAWDQNLCQGFARCVETDPDHFRLEDDGTLTVLVEQVTPEIRTAVTAAVRACPVAALRATSL
jgi:ferredoxin